jgi:predicted N-formylglutamate amidohydrolase
VEDAVAAKLEGPNALSQGIISIHSFSAIWDCHRRACQIGIMWRRDDRLSTPLLSELRKLRQFAVEDNKPYSFAESDLLTLDRHGLAIGVPNAYIEVRNDLLRPDAAIKAMAETLSPAIKLAFAGLRLAA